MAFKSLVDDASWMDEDTKILAREKAESMVSKIGYPDWMKDSTALEKYYEGVQHLSIENLG